MGVCIGDVSDCYRHLLSRLPKRLKVMQIIPISNKVWTCSSATEKLVLVSTCLRDPLNKCVNRIYIYILYILFVYFMNLSETFKVLKTYMPKNMTNLCHCQRREILRLCCYFLLGEGVCSCCPIITILKSCSSRAENFVTLKIQFPKLYHYLYGNIIIF